MSALQAPSGENILLAAYHAVSAARANPTPAPLEETYRQHFVPAVPVQAGQLLMFERFSLVDPRIYTTIRSNTESV